MSSDDLMVAPVEAGEDSAVATPRQLFDGAALGAQLSGFDANNPTYDVAPDGERFLVLQTVTTNQSAVTLWPEWAGPQAPEEQPAAPSQARFRGSLLGSGVYDAPAPGRLRGVRWSLETGGPVRSSPAVFDGTVFVGSGDGHLYAVDAQSNRQRWRFPTTGRVRSSPVVADGVVYFGGTDGVVYALRATNGEPIWRHQTEGAQLDSSAFGYDRTSITSSPVLSGDLLVIGSRDGHLYAIDRRSGRRVWRQDHHLSWVIGSPAVSAGLAFTGSSYGRFFAAVRLGSGEELWRYLTPDRVFSSGAVIGEVVVFGCDDGHLFALDTRTGTERWRFRAGGQVISSPVVVGDTVYFGSDDGTLYAVETEAAATEALTARPRKAVFWESRRSMRWFQGDEAVRDFLSAEGYEVLDAALLAEFLRARLDDGAASVVVLAVDHLPETVLGEASGSGLLTRYLEGGGRVVWLGAPPDILELDPKTGRGLRLDPSRPTRLLGVDHASVGWDSLGVEATPTGLGWGLPAWWVGSLGVDPQQVTTVLGRDEYGRAGAWIKSFGGPEGSGFVRLWGRAEAIEDVSWVQAVAEHGLN